ncbi:MAG TPA: hypothetical protein VK206_24095 [Anaerolineales bacterium]|nr:hypothetical protein [Anaerolineales bacterium]
MKPTPTPQDQEQDQEIIEILKTLGSVNAEYPPELLAARRAAFVAAVEQTSEVGVVKKELPSRKEFLKRLEDLSSVRTEYPSELLAARRAAFVARVEQLSNVEVREELTAKDQEIIRLLKNVKSFEPDYSPKALTARRAAFVRQMRGGSISLLEALRSSIQSIFRYRIQFPAMPTMNMMRTSLVLAVLMVAAFIGSLLFGNRGQLLVPAPTQAGVTRPVLPVAAGTKEAAKVICKPGYLPPLCLAKKFDKTGDLTYQGNGAARPAVAKDTLPGYSGIHKASYVNDGLYGPGASWVSNSAYSWIKIDLGKETTINTVTFGRDRLGNLNDRDPGQFVIAVAQSDNIYADGNSSNDFVEYTEVYNSAQDGFNGIVSGPQTIRAQFQSVKARYVKITFENPGTAVDEVEVFMVQPARLADSPTRRPRDDAPSQIVIPVPSNTPLPPDTPTPVPTATALPTDTSVPTDTPLPPDTSTPRPTHTPQPTDTSTPRPTRTPLPTDTPVPLLTDTPIVPTDTPVPPPTDTAEPPTIVVPTDTPVPVVP